jgi:hypothetical protein
VDDTPSTTSVDTPSTTRVNTSPTIDTTSRSPSKSNVKETMCERLNIRTPDKATLALELVGEMKTPDRAPLMRYLITGSKNTVPSLNNKIKEFFHVPQCANEAAAAAAFRKYDVVERIVKKVGGGKNHQKGLTSVLFG